MIVTQKATKNIQKKREVQRINEGAKDWKFDGFEV